MAGSFYKGSHFTFLLVKKKTIIFIKISSPIEACNEEPRYSIKVSLAPRSDVSIIPTNRNNNCAVRATTIDLICLVLLILIPKSYF